MIRLFVRLAIALASNAVGLIVAAAVLDMMTLNATGFVVAVAVYTVVFALLQPFRVGRCCVRASVSRPQEVPRRTLAVT